MKIPYAKDLLSHLYNYYSITFAYGRGP